MNTQIKNVKTLRDNIYAHTDYPNNIDDIDVSLSDVDLLLNFAEEVLQDIYTVMDVEFDAETSLSGVEDCNILELLVIGYKQRQDDITREIRMQMSDIH